MRIFLAKVLVTVTGLLIVTLAILFAVIRNAGDSLAPAPPDEAGAPAPEIVAGPAAAGATPRTPPADPDGPPDTLAKAAAPSTGDAIGQTPQSEIIARGRAVYLEQRCSMCHSLDGEGNTRSPLDGVGRLPEKEIRLWIVAPREMDPAVPKRGYRLSEGDLDALVAYLVAGH